MEHSDFAEFESRVKRKYRRKVWMVNHTLAFAAIVGAIWLHYLSFAGQSDFHINTLVDRLIVTLVWFVLLVIHYFNYRQEAAMDREIEREYEARVRLGDEKPKREEDAPAIGWDDDGEFILLDEAYDESQNQNSGSL